jgi:cytochrome c biogenesis protein CcmG, thiol:disulfide interchange protein DsbE
MSDINVPTTTASVSFAQRARFWVLFLLLLGLVAGYPKLLRWFGGGENHAAVGEQLTEISFHPLQPDNFPRADVDQLAGKVVLINYWGTWCFPCRLELPHLAKLYDQWRDEPNIRFFFVSCEDQLTLPELTNKTLEFLEREGHEGLPVYADPGQASRRHLAEVASFEDGFDYPTTLILDGEQRIRGLWRGFRPTDIAAQQALLKQLLR